MSENSTLVVVGAKGRMGQRLISLAPEQGFTSVVGVDHDGPTLSETLSRGAACVVDFSVRAQIPGTAQCCIEYGVPFVMGTTGLDAADHAVLDQASSTVPVVWAPNFSVGVNTLFALVSEAARMLGEGWDVELVEAHHRRKVDAPSGTARELARRVAAARGWELDAVARYGREGDVGARPADQLGVSVVRGGSVVGDHEVRLLGDGEQLILEHRAGDRDIFVLGALRACRWLVQTTPKAGRYGMTDVLR
ncbi:MAG: 4-hydroxy-tetrahydrodipicolinate reductase [Myxococcota bacterium]|jgi:4-hydroxy-tetrahydrodipicolinate reductase